MRKAILIVFFMVTALVISGCSKLVIPDIGDQSFGDKIIVFKSPTCGCCGGYVNELKEHGFDVEKIETENIIQVKNKYNIPPELQSCHTSFIKGYFVEGHVPIEAVNKMLEEKPDIDGIGLAGMPSGSAGMPGQKRGAFKVYSIKDGKAEDYMTI